MSTEELKEVILNGVRYVRQDGSDYVEAVVGGLVHIGFADTELVALELKNPKGNGNCRFSYRYGLPEGARVRIMVVKKGA